MNWRENLLRKGTRRPLQSVDTGLFIHSLRTLSHSMLRSRRSQSRNRSQSQRRVSFKSTATKNSRRQRHSLLISDLLYQTALNLKTGRGGASSFKLPHQRSFAIRISKVSGSQSQTLWRRSKSSSRTWRKVLRWISPALLQPSSTPPGLPPPGNNPSNPDDEGKRENLVCRKL